MVFKRFFLISMIFFIFNPNLFILGIGRKAARMPVVEPMLIVSASELDWIQKTN